jgi:hypothetical protein
MVLTFDQQKELTLLKHDLALKEKEKQLINEQQEHNDKMQRLNKLEEIMKLTNKQELIKVLKEVM